MAVTTTTPRAAAGRRARRLLGSPLVDLLVGPHGIDRYLELIRPDMTISDARAEVIDVRRQTARTVTLKVRPNPAFGGFQAGQFVRLGVEIDGVRRTRTFSPAGSQHAPDGMIEFTVTQREGGLVSRHLRDRVGPGAILHLARAEGEFGLPAPPERPGRLVLISGGSGITPVMSMLRTLCDEEHDGQVWFQHFGRTEQDWLYRPEVEALAARRPNLHFSYLATREGGTRLGDGSIPIPLDADVAVCGPPALIEATRRLYAHAPERVIAETFTPPTRAPSPAGEAHVDGTLRFLASGTESPIAGGTLLEQAEAAGLTPEFGCRMGICHTCTCRKTAGAVKNILTGAVSDEEDEDIQLCISVPAGDVHLQL
jgi:ferredoxin-NADP reductase